MSRLLVYSRENKTIEDRIFRDITEYLVPGDVLVRNVTKVIPARLYATREDTGGVMEFLLLKRVNDTDWECLVKPGRKARPGRTFTVNDELSVTVLETLEDGNRIVRLNYEGIFEEVLDRAGEMPLPPYITKKLEDRSRYQTVYARDDGSAAAPTAGLHFTPELLQKLREKDVLIADVLLHVGLGTFRPVSAENVEEHHMHSEYWQVTPEAAELINSARANGGRIVSVGTTGCRTLESASTDDGIVHAGSGWTDIFITPGYRFKAVDALITNFHLPESTLLMLISAFCSREEIMRVYEHAVKERYRFFSFGDACLFI
jgi:S-adenosylmethionine:tRNA ribosyltransferase-isomerase